MDLYRVMSARISMFKGLSPVNFSILLKNKVLCSL